MFFISIYIIYCLWAHAAVASPTNSSTDIGLEKRVDLSRFQFVDCTPDQRHQLYIAVDTVEEFVTSGLRAADCPLPDPRLDTFSYFFRRNADDAVVKAVFSTILSRLIPANQGGTNTVLPIRCVSDRDAHCHAPTPYSPLGRLSYAGFFDMRPYNLANYPGITSATNERGFLSVISLCPRLWMNIAPLPVPCEPGMDQRSMPLTLASILLKELVHTASGLGIVDGGAGLPLLFDSVQASLALVTHEVPNLQMVPALNAMSYVYSAYLAWRARWTENIDFTRGRRRIRRCLVKLFGPVDSDETDSE